MSEQTRILVKGFYVPTEKFKQIIEHVAICDPDGNLIGVVGPSDDSRSNETAESFVVAINSYAHDQEIIQGLLEAAKKARESLAESREMLGVFEDNGGHDGLMGKGYAAVLDHIDTAKVDLKEAALKAEEAAQ